MLDIETFDARSGGNVLYKALAHPLIAEKMVALAGRLAEFGSIAVFDPDDIAGPLWVMHPSLPPIADIYVQDVAHIGRLQSGYSALPVTALADTSSSAVLIAVFDASAIAARLHRLVPQGVEIYTLDEARLPAAMLSNPHRLFDRLNFATNWAFFRDTDEMSTRLTTANYWERYGACSVRLWLRLFDQNGQVLATWEEVVPSRPAGIVLDSAEIRRRFRLPAFTGQLFIHVLGAAGHDVVKYALDIIGTHGNVSLSCTHDANAWPSERYAGLPAPEPDELMLLWVQNSHATPIPAGAVMLDRMGAGEPVAYPYEVAAFATVALDIGHYLPSVQWPAQIEVLAGRHCVRPRYEVIRHGRTYIAHVNVERSDLQPNPVIAQLSSELGRGFLLPVPVLPRVQFRTWIQPTPMATSQQTLPLRLDVFAPDGTSMSQHFLGCLKRDHAVAVDLDDILPEGVLVEGGHIDIVYDFRDGGQADGWLHTLVRCEHRSTGHRAESSFGGHIYNTLMTFGNEPQSYSGPPPGLSTRLFLKLGQDERHSFAQLIYPSSAEWNPTSETYLLLHDATGAIIAEQYLTIPCSGSALIFPHLLFGGEQMQRAGESGYVLIRDVTCRLFGYHGLMQDDGRFAMDHMFGF